MSSPVGAVEILSAAVRQLLQQLERSQAAVARLEADVAERARLTTSGGLAPRPSVAWSNPATTVEAHHDYRGRL